MKNKIWSLILLFLVGLVLAYIYRYKTASCVCDSIPQDADAVVQVQVRQLEKHLLHDKLAHPLSFLQSSGGDASAQDPISKTSFLEVVVPPKSLLFYRTGQNDKLWLSSALAIKEASKLDQFVSENDYSSRQEKGISIYTSGKHQLIVENNTLRIAYGDDLDQSSELLNSKYKGFQKEGDKLFNALRKSTSDVTYTDSKGQQLYLDFNQGTITLDGQYHIPALRPSTDEAIIKDGLGQLSAKLDPKKAIKLLDQKQLETFSNFTKLNLDSITVNMTREINAVLHDLSVTTDTITTYEYDDDFNKVEVKKLKENLSPNFVVALGMKDEAISYMKQQKAIVEQAGKEILAVMPLVTTYCKKDQSTLQLYTEDAVFARVTPSKSKLSCYLDVSRYLATTDSEAHKWNKFLEDLSTVDISISNEDKVTGKILFQDDRNALVSLLR